MGRSPRRPSGGAGRSAPPLPKNHDPNRRKKKQKKILVESQGLSTAFSRTFLRKGVLLEPADRPRIFCERPKIKKGVSSYRFFLFLLEFFSVFSSDLGRGDSEKAQSFFAGLRPARTPARGAPPLSRVRACVVCVCVCVCLLATVRPNGTALNYGAAIYPYRYRYRSNLNPSCCVLLSLCNCGNCVTAIYFSRVR